MLETVEICDVVLSQPLVEDAHARLLIFEEIIETALERAKLLHEPVLQLEGPLLGRKQEPVALLARVSGFDAAQSLASIACAISCTKKGASTPIGAPGS